MTPLAPWPISANVLPMLATPSEARRVRWVIFRGDARRAMCRCNFRVTPCSLRHKRLPQGRRHHNPTHGYSLPPPSARPRLEQRVADRRRGGAQLRTQLLLLLPLGLLLCGDLVGGELRGQRSEAARRRRDRRRGRGRRVPRRREQRADGPRHTEGFGGGGGRLREAMGRLVGRAQSDSGSNIGQLGPTNRLRSQSDRDANIMFPATATRL